MPDWLFWVLVVAGGVALVPVILNLMVVFIAGLLAVIASFISK